MNWNETKADRTSQTNVNGSAACEFGCWWNVTWAPCCVCGNKLIHCTICVKQRGAWPDWLSAVHQMPFLTDQRDCVSAGLVLEKKLCVQVKLTLDFQESFYEDRPRSSWWILACVRHASTQGRRNTGRSGQWRSQPKNFGGKNFWGGQNLWL